MVNSLFLSPAFLFAESSFIVVASLAAYELLVGDFIWAQQEEARRASVQSRRGRGYDSFEESRRRMQHHRSLSPGGRGRGGGGGGAATPRGGMGGGGGGGAPSRRASVEESSLLHPSSRATPTRGTMAGGNHRMSSEEGYYSSPSDARFASPGRGSSGDSTRRLFYKAILLALLSRFVLLPVETLCLFEMDNNNSAGRTILSDIEIDSTSLRVILRLSQTFPDAAFASALGILVIFCAQTAFAAMPPLTPDSSDVSVRDDDDTEIIDEETGEREGLLGEGSVQGAENSGVCGRFSHEWKKRSRIARTWCARLSRTILASKKTFVAWNFIIFASYAFVFLADLAIPHVPPPTSEISLWLLMITIFSLLSLSLVYVAVLLGRALRPGIARRKNSKSLAIRLVATCTLLAIMFVDRVVFFGTVAHRAYVDSDGSHRSERIRTSYTRSTLEFAFSESLPVLLILLMMHRKRKEIQNDVLVLWSLFGSTGRLNHSECSQSEAAAATATPSAASGEGTGGVGAAVSRGGGLAGARRFQSYGGAASRGDSFPPSTSGNGGKPRRNNMPRAASSSGGGGGARSQQHHAGGTDALVSEGGSNAAGISKKGGMKPYMPV